MTVARAIKPDHLPTGEPAWEIARLFPEQGAWSEDDYLSLNTNHLIEYSHGFVEVLPMPTDAHQAIVAFLYRALLAFAERGKLGRVRFSPLPLRLWKGKFREPDILFLLSANDARRGKRFWKGADLVMEVVSESNRQHDVEKKRFEYARAGIPEYWIIDSQKSRITVLKLDGTHFIEHGVFHKGSQATSAFLPGFSIGVSAVIAAE